MIKANAGYKSPARRGSHIFYTFSSIFLYFKWSDVNGSLLEGVLDNGECSFCKLLILNTSIESDENSLGIYGLVGRLPLSCSITRLSPVVWSVAKNILTFIWKYKKKLIKKQSDQNQLL